MCSKLNKCLTSRGLRSLGLVLGVLVLGLGFTVNALADQSPAGCNGNAFNVILDKSKTNVVPGDTVTYTVKVANTGTNNCDVNQVTFDFFCPAADGQPTGTETNVVTNASYPAGTPETQVGSFNCTMPVFNAGVVSAQAKVDGTGNLRDNPLGDDLFSILKTVSVNVLTCNVQVDKQISCDGGQTWADALNATPGDPQYAPDGANGCTTLEQNQVLVRYYVKNTGTADLSGCAFNDDNNAFGDPTGLPAAPFDILSQDEQLYPASLEPLCKDAKPGEPDTATVSCNICGGVTQGSPITDSDQANLSCLTTLLKVDKQVNCGGGFVDAYGLTTNNDVDNGQSAGTCISPANCQTQGCSAADGAPISAQYVAANTGTAPLYACQLIDTNNLFGVINPQVGNLAAGASVNKTAPNTPLCSANFDGQEPDTVTLTCCVDNVANLLDCVDGRTVQVNDIADVKCLAPDLNVTKTCALDQLNQDIVTVTVTNTGAADLENCVATDLYYTADATCDLTGLPLTNAAETGASTGLSLTGSPIASLPAGSGAVNLSGSIVGLVDQACNTVGVTCNVAGTANTITRFAKDECEVPELGCLTRTPGFWATHPFIIAGSDPRSLDLLPLSICGTEIDITSATAATSKNPACDYSGHSTSEAMCSVGRDAKCLNDGDNVAQLIRQCTAAKLNVAASIELGGSCANTLDIADTIAGCCDTENTCVTGDFTVGYCIDALDAFNNWDFDSLNFPFNTGPADPRQCQNAKNNGVVVSP